MELSLSGGCLCGGVRFELSAAPKGARYCHCKRCQRRSGCPATANAAVTAGTVRVVQGEDLLLGWTPPDGNEKVFCRECGSALFSQDPGSGQPTGVRLGAFDGDPGVRPSARQWVASAAPWEPIPDDGLPRYEGAAP